MKEAIKIAKKGEAIGEVPVGAVLIRHPQPRNCFRHPQVRSNNVILSERCERGDLPRLISKAFNKKENSNDPTAHAEILAIQEASKKLNNWRLLNTILYITAEPCAMCAGAIIQARIPLIVYGCREERFGAVESNYNVLNNKNSNHHPVVISGILEEECKELLQNFFENLRRGGRVVEGGSLENCSTGNCTGN